MSKELQLPESIAAFIEATNARNTAAFLATLTDSAVLTDEGQGYRGIRAIQEWSDERYIGAKVTLEVVDLMNGNGKTVVTLKIDGDFDKTGLPDPFLMDFYFTLDANKIAALDIGLPGEKPRD